MAARPRAISNNSGFETNQAERTGSNCSSKGL